MRTAGLDISGITFDVVVVGAGVNGCGVARDAAMRGLRVLLLDKGDIAAGTTAASTRLIHGGLRYLEHGEVGLVRESLRERETLLGRVAPHLVRPLPLVVAAFEGQRPDRLLGVGLNMYDVMSRESLRRRRRDANADREADWSPDRHRIVDGEERGELRAAELVE